MAFFDKHPISGPERSPIFKPVPRFYKGYRKLSVYCEASREGIEKSIPEGFKCEGTIIEVFVMHCPEVHDISKPEMGPRNYSEGGVVVSASYGDLVGGHVLYEYVSTDEAMASGREIWGYPKKLAEVSFQEKNAGYIAASVNRLGRTLIDARFSPADVNFEKPVLHPRIQVKRIPRADGEGYDVDKIIRNDLRNPKLLQLVRGTATLSLGGSPIMDPLFELDVKQVIGAEFIIAEFYLDYGKIYEDRLALKS
jgi:acetoacetate decarboxylase